MNIKNKPRLLDYLGDQPAVKESDMTEQQPKWFLVQGYEYDAGGGGEQPPGEAPGGIWGGGNVPMPNPPIANVPGAPGYQPPGQGGGGGDHIWGGGNEPFPTPPIVIPPQQPGQPPLVIWGPNDPRPTPPINLPGGGNPPPGGEQVKLIEWKTAWTPDTGWVVVGVPQVPHPSPSGQHQLGGQRRP